jgi:hypothetical protein
VRGRSTGKGSANGYSEGTLAERAAGSQAGPFTATMSERRVPTPMTLGARRPRRRNAEGTIANRHPAPTSHHPPPVGRGLEPAGPPERRAPRSLPSPHRSSLRMTWPLGWRGSSTSRGASAGAPLGCATGARRREQRRHDGHGRYDGATREDHASEHDEAEADDNRHQSSQILDFGLLRGRVTPCRVRSGPRYGIKTILPWWPGSMTAS